MTDADWQREGHRWRLANTNGTGSVIQPHFGLTGTEPASNLMFDPASDGGAPDRHRVELRVPGSEIYLEMIRSVVGRAARLAGFTYDGIEDFALAVHEATVLLLLNDPEVLVVSMVVSEAENLTADVRVGSSVTSWPPGDLDDDIRWQVLSALCDDVQLVDGNTPGISLSQPVR